ncbi:MAG: helix-turn-helix transcriptional regulator [Bacteroidales bacterium]|nr:helix-turn-helix transcriptional regulator [Bacteroidales bacterium]
MLRVKEILKARGMTAKQLAPLIGITEGALSLQIKDGANPRLDSLEKIANALGVRTSELLDEPQALNGTVTCPHCGKPIELCVK